MTQDEIIEMAEQAGMRQDGDMWFSLGKGDMDVEHNHLETFAKLVAAKAIQELREEIIYSWVPPHFVDLAVEAEREQCAKVCENLALDDAFTSDILQVTAAVIRARGEA